MACVRNTLCFFAVLLLISQKTVTSNFLSPIFDNICKVVECGKGTCEESSNSTFMYECVCEDGWKQFDNLKFLPCIIPNCTFGLKCGEAASPPQLKAPPKNNDTSILDVCHWVDCGGGVCNKTGLLSYKCDCREGYNNLMKINMFPCIKQCALGTDCLNNPMSNASSSSPPALPDSSKNEATGLKNLGGPSLWLIISMLCVSLAPWRLLYI